MAKTAAEKREYQREAQRRWRAAHPEYKEKAKQARQHKIENMTPDELAKIKEKRNANQRRRYNENKTEAYLRLAACYAKMAENAARDQK